MEEEEVGPLRNIYFAASCKIVCLAANWIHVGSTKQLTRKWDLPQKINDCTVFFTRSRSLTSFLTENNIFFRIESFELALWNWIRKLDLETGSGNWIYIHMILMCAVHRLSYTLNLYAHNSISKLLMKVSFFYEKISGIRMCVVWIPSSFIGIRLWEFKQKKSGQSAQYYLGYSLPKKSPKKLGLIFDFKRQN